MDQIVWSWAIFGVILIALELMTGTFYILCGGIAALLVAFFVAIIPFSFANQLFFFILFSIANLCLWHFKFKGKKSEFLIGQSDDGTVGQIGDVVEALGDNKFIVKFQNLVLGSRSWSAISSDTLDVRDKVVVISIEGNNLRVKKL